MSSSEMAAAAFEHAPLPPHLSAAPGMHPVAMSRPQVSIERLPTRRMSNEPRESMNCKSCRKRKIKCNRLRPSCEACQVFQCPCIYDAVPKKRGPKTDVLEALLKRVDGLEQRLKDQKSTDPGAAAAVAAELAALGSAASEVSQRASLPTAATSAGDKSKSDATTSSRTVDVPEPVIYSPSASSEPSPTGPVPVDALLDTYFSRFHGKPYHILGESSIRQRLLVNQVPSFLAHAIYAVAARYTPHPSGFQSAVQLSEEYALRARNEIDTDEPSIDALQALLLTATAFTAMGRGRKAYMLLTSGIGMAMALELHREVDPNAPMPPAEREMRRRLFWSCFLMDRFMACGSKRPSLISNRVISTRLPSWSPGPHSLPVEGEFFVSGSNLHYFQGSGKRSQGSSGMLIDISRILGITNRYLAAGGVKGDSHFPWHSLSNLSKIRQDLDIWASGTEDVFSSVGKLFGQPDSTVLVLSKLIYHLIHCLIYRPFLPIDLVELAGSGQHQSWQIEATNMCFLHANAIAELAELGKSTIEWPAFVGYCICTAGTVHVHGAFYSKNSFGGDGSGGGVFSSSADFLSREMQQLSELRYAWASVQHQRETLQGIYGAHAELVKSHARNPMRYAPVFQLEDFFDRYSNIGGPGGQSFHFDSANISLSDVVVDYNPDVYTGHDLYAPRASTSSSATGGLDHSPATASAIVPPTIPSDRPSLKRKKMAPTGIKAPPPPPPHQQQQQTMHSDPGMPTKGGLQPLNTAAGMVLPHTPHSLPTPSHSRHSFTFQPPQGSPVMLQSPAGGPQMHQVPEQMGAGGGVVDDGRGGGFGMHGQQQHHMQHQALQQQYGHHSPYGYGGAGTGPESIRHGTSSSSMGPGTPGGGGGGGGSYDPMFGTLPTNAFSSPAPGPWQQQHPGAGGGAAGGSEDGKQHGGGGQVLAHSPGGRSNNGSTGTGAAGEEKDPFLSLLEQLAENEQAMGPGSELDMFLGTTAQR
ncbi:hypothetical protein GGTG_00276 [Gaeumannomyces tritici R3-111a-1]|uniref:Zn(2)-C6 fungal-type domain-containing protein n=1 Tax=Gaeumannomyces tritici (strain R3-111a-1) TaxID=644352 RepID=J3NG83_GAET3|nr:hypothetical protein GGTG_00276 [Gaeumannomyces tritici R3-111a-1]EJT80273.1 hypothetical protein GGTG_00276 [Gaeumannomyces tritici R3-111a-1]